MYSRKTDLGVEQQPAWGKNPNHAIDPLSYTLATIHLPAFHPDSKKSGNMGDKCLLERFDSLGVGGVENGN